MYFFKTNYSNTLVYQKHFSKELIKHKLFFKNNYKNKQFLEVILHTLILIKLIYTIKHLHFSIVTTQTVKSDIHTNATVEEPLLQPT